MSIWNSPELLTADFTNVVTMRHLVGLFTIWVVYRILRALYNISPLHPLYQFPGPKLAAMTLAYEAWYDLIKGGRYTWEIQRMHDKYGPIVRISPFELHCSDPAFIDEIYAGATRRRSKSPHMMRSLVWPLDTTGFGTLDHDLHRARRAPLGRHFSRAQILRLESTINYRLQRFCDKLLALGVDGGGGGGGGGSPGSSGDKSSVPFDVIMAYSCFASDVISGYSFGEPLGLLEQDGWEPNWRLALYAFLRTTYLFRFVPAFRHLVALGEFFARRGWMGPDVEMLMNTVHVRLPRMISKACERAAAGIETTGGDKGALFLDVLNSDVLPESDKTMPHVAAESLALLNAGTETVSWALAVVTFHLLSKPRLLARLTEELTAAVPDAGRPSWTSLEKLPFLGGVVMEGLRLGNGTSARSPRIAEDEDLVYRGETRGDGRKVEYVIPRGWAIGMTVVLVHNDEDLFPSAGEFVPERWLDEEGNRRRDLEKYIMSFSKGSRQCIGMNLAYCELYLSVATLALRVFPRMKLYETSVDDVIHDHDLFLVPMPKKGSKGVRVTIS